MSKLVTIAIDAMGGDGSPKKVIDGIVNHYKNSKNIFYRIFGDKDKIKNLIPITLNNNVFEIVHTKKFVKGTTKEDLFLTFTKKDSRKINVFLEYTGPIKAPISKDQKIADLKVYKDKELLKNIPVFASTEVKKINFIKSVFSSINFMIWGDV